MSAHIETTLQEQRVFESPEDFKAHANIQGLDAYHRLCKQAEDDPETFWAGIAVSCTGSSPGSRCWSGSAVGEMVRWRPDQSLV